MSEKELAQELFGGKSPSMKERIQAALPGLDGGKIAGDLRAELKQQLAAGAHELAAALFNGSGFVMYPRGTREDHGIHGPENKGIEQPDHGLDNKGIESPEQKMGGKGMGGM